MLRTIRRLTVPTGRITRTVVLLSAVLAVTTVTLPFGFTLPLKIFIVSALTARWFARLILPLVLVAAYVTPVMSLLMVGGEHYSYGLVWMAALLGLIAGTSLFSDWSLPVSWRWALVAWALIIALSWPLVAWRELDYRFASAGATRLPLTTMKFAASLDVNWIAYTASVQLLGLLWIDWLVRRYRTASPREFAREVIAPLGAAILIASALGVYQGTVNVSFLSGHAWPVLQRSVGTFVDANVFGMLAALWAPVFLMLAWSSGDRVKRTGALAAALLASAGVWTSASRTGLLALLVGMTLTAGELSRAASSRVPRVRLLLIASGVATAVLLIAALSPLKTTTALQRARDLAPSPTTASIRHTAHRLWDRDGYGAAAVAMIREFPLGGVGIGSFHMLSHDFAMQAAGVWIPPDNAQNWFRHQLAELGIIGSLGWIVWVVVFLRQLVRATNGDARTGIASRGPLIAFGVASLLGMPGQDAAVTMTFWVLACWFAADARILDRSRTGALTGIRWIGIVVLVCACVAARAADGDLRPPFRAARFGVPYSYGFIDGQPSFTNLPRAVTVISSPKPWLKFTYWVEHPDAATRPVRVQIWRDHDRIVDRKLYNDVRVTKYIAVPGDNKRFVLEVEVDRMFIPSGDTREHGLNLKWEFVDIAPVSER